MNKKLNSIDIINKAGLLYGQLKYSQGQIPNPENITQIKSAQVRAAITVLVDEINKILKETKIIK